MHDCCMIICNVSFIVVVTWLKIVAVYWWHSLVHSHTDHFVLAVDCCQSDFFCSFFDFFVCLKRFLCSFVYLFIFFVFVDFSSLSSPLEMAIYLISFLFCISTVNRWETEYSVRYAYRYTGTRNQNQRIKKYTAVQHTMLLGM